MATVTGRTSLACPVYSPTWSSCSVVLSSSSPIHWRTAVTLVVRTRVELPTRAMHSIPTTVFPAPQGSTTTPLPPRSLPPAWKAPAALAW